jgi:hypothetical protein
MEKHALSIWFFIGVILLPYGVIIFSAGIYGLFVPPAQAIVLWKLHAGIWWGLLLVAMGVFYLYRFYPRGYFKKNARASDRDVRGGGAGEAIHERQTSDQ